MRTLLFACVAVITALQLQSPASKFFTANFKVRPEAYMNDPRCLLSEFGPEICQQNLLKFIQLEGKEPLSDYELELIFGCIRSDNAGNTVNQQPNMPGC